MLLCRAILTGRIELARGITVPINRALKDDSKLGNVSILMSISFLKYVAAWFKIKTQTPNEAISDGITYVKL